MNLTRSSWIKSVGSVSWPVPNVSQRWHETLPEGQELPSRAWSSELQAHKALVSALISLSACLFASFLVCLLAYLLACLLACILGFLPVCLLACRLPTCLPACLPICLRLSACLPTCLSACLSGLFVFICLSFSLSVLSLPVYLSGGSGEQSFCEDRQHLVRWVLFCEWLEQSEGEAKSTLSRESQGNRRFGENQRQGCCIRTIFGFLKGVLLGLAAQEQYLQSCELCIWGKRWMMPSFWVSRQLGHTMT